MAKTKTAPDVQGEHARILQAIRDLDAALSRTKEELSVVEGEHAVAIEEAFARGEKLPDPPPKIGELRSRISSLESQLQALRASELRLRERVLAEEVEALEHEHEEARRSLEKAQKALQRAQRAFGEARAAEAGAYTQLSHRRDELRRVRRETGSWIEDELSRLRAEAAAWADRQDPPGLADIGGVPTAAFNDGLDRLNPFAERIKELERQLADQRGG